MYLLLLRFYKSSESQHPDKVFELEYLKGDPLSFAEVYNLQEDVFAGEVDYLRETNIEEVRKWLEDGIISLYYPSKDDSQEFNEIISSDTSPRLVITAYYWQSGYD